MTVTALHPARMAAAARGDLAERAVSQAQELAFLVRDEGRDAIGKWLDTHAVPRDDKLRLLLVALAAMVDIDATEDHLLSWVTWDEFGQPLPGATPAAPAPVVPLQPGCTYVDCGTAKAYWRHERAGHPRAQIEACGCGQAYRDYWNAKHASRHGDGVSSREKSAVNLAEYTRLTRDLHLSRAEAAARLGITMRTVNRYEARLRAAQEEAASAAA